MITLLVFLVFFVSAVAGCFVLCRYFSAGKTPLLKSPHHHDICRLADDGCPHADTGESHVRGYIRAMRWMPALRFAPDQELGENLLEIEFCVGDEAVKTYSLSEKIEIIKDGTRITRTQLQDERGMAKFYVDLEFSHDVLVRVTLPSH